jgi:hypothetical protein
MTTSTIFFLFGSFFGMSAETRGVTGFHFKEVICHETLKYTESKTPVRLRVRQSFPKNAHEPILEVIAYEHQGLMHSGDLAVVPSRRKGYKHQTFINGFTVFFNF